MKKLFKNKLLLLPLGGVTSAFAFTSCNNTKAATEEEKQADNHVVKFEEMKTTQIQIWGQLLAIFKAINEEISSNAFENEQDLNHFIDKWSELNFFEKYKELIKKHSQVLFGVNYLAKINQLNKNFIAVIEGIAKDENTSVIQNKVKAFSRLYMTYVFGKDNTFKNMQNFFASIPTSDKELAKIISIALPSILKLPVANIPNIGILVEKLAGGQISEEDIVNEITNVVVPVLMNSKEEFKKIVDLLKNKEIKNENDWFDKKEVQKLMDALFKEGAPNESLWIFDLLINNGEKVKQLSSSEKAKILEFMRLMKQQIAETLPLYLSSFEALKLIISPE
ncbi:hypothetical protein [Mycoplasmopsis gallinacea]|uniref:Lipoprotein n=1 Tax=Mycoplasmopsis gallinacea TaxID=29556 RepID=A0A6H0V308_9BACT|nr:hypothetical protein [Mycoplasmopsis gallinacea]QIW61866.1 hypothetical protein GOQ20_00035 [Mycoplasmopsis gallinacea]